ncbi:MAG: hypothetical protein ABIP71_01465 [Verrucomicrobiota bacterium]
MNELYAEIKEDQWLLRHARNINSLSGEDGILEKIFEVLPPGDKWCVEFGAWDGIKYSNTWNLISERDWSAVLIEADSEKFVDLQANCKKFPKAHCLNYFVTFEGENSLEALLKKTAIPKNFDLLSIDIDGDDYHIWESVKEYTPKVVVIEFNPTVPSHVEFVQPRDMSVNQGSSLLSLISLGKKKGYELICVTDYNGIFVQAQFLNLFKLTKNDIVSLRPPNPSQCPQFHIFQLYDGTFVVGGGTVMPWFGIPIHQEKFQILPKFLRKYPTFSNSLFQRVLRRVWYLFYINRFI